MPSAALQTPSYSLKIRWATVEVPSRSKPGETHTVTLDPRDGEPVDCTCGDARHRRRRCYHQREAAAGRCSKPRVRAVQVPPENVQVFHRQAFDAYVTRAAASVASVRDLYGE